MLRSLQAMRGTVGRGLFAAAALVVAGCKYGDLVAEAPTVDGILLSMPRSLVVGQTGQASAQAVGSNGLIISSSKVRVSFASRDAAVARVDASSGVITAVAPGKAAIAAESQGQIAVDTVTVVAR